MTYYNFSYMNSPTADFAGNWWNKIANRAAVDTQLALDYAKSGTRQVVSAIKNKTPILTDEAKALVPDNLRQLAVQRSQMVNALDEAAGVVDDVLPAKQYMALPSASAQPSVGRTVSPSIRVENVPKLDPYSIPDPWAYPVAPRANTPSAPISQSLPALPPAPVRQRTRPIGNRRRVVTGEVVPGNSAYQGIFRGYNNSYLPSRKQVSSTTKASVTPSVVASEAQGRRPLLTPRNIALGLGAGVAVGTPTAMYLNSRYRNQSPSYDEMYDD